MTDTPTTDQAPDLTATVADPAPAPEQATATVPDPAAVTDVAPVLEVDQAAAEAAALVDQTPEPSVAVPVEPTSTEATWVSDINSGGVQTLVPAPDPTAGEPADATAPGASALPVTPEAAGPVVAPHRGGLVTYSWFDIYDDAQRSIVGVVTDVHDTPDGPSVDIVWLGTPEATLPWAQLRPFAD